MAQRFAERLDAPADQTKVNPEQRPAALDPPGAVGVCFFQIDASQTPAGDQTPRILRRLK